MNEGISSVSYALIKPPKRRWINLYLGISISVLALITWMAFVNLDVMVFANGKVIPASALKTVQHFEGGIVAEIYVRKGDVVNVGDKLLKVNNINVRTQLGEVNTHLSGIIGALIRLEAEILAKETLVFSDAFINASPDITRHEQELFKQNSKALHEQVSLVQDRLIKNRQEQDEFKKQRDLSRQSISLMQEELTLSESLFEEDAISKMELLQLRRSMHALMAKKQNITGQLLAKQNEAHRIRQELDERRSKFTSEAITKRNELENKKNGLLKMGLS